MSLLEQAKKYIHGEEILRQWVGDGAVPVERELAEKRAAVCLKCPKNEPGFVPVETVALAIKKLVSFKNDMQLRVNGERSLFTCSACSCPLRTKIWIPFERIAPDEQEKQLLDAACWLLHET